METGTLILIASFIIPLIVIISILIFLKRRIKKDQLYSEELGKKITAARPATAVVLSASQGLTGGDINRIIHLKLQISDGFGPPYEAKTTWFVNTLHFDNIRTGNTIMVKVDANDRNIIYPAESWGKFTSGYENL